MTINQLAAGGDPSQGQAAGTACVGCGADEVPLHRGETITTRYGDGVVRDTTVVRCTLCLIAQRRPANAEATQ